MVGVTFSIMELSPPKMISAFFVCFGAGLVWLIGHCARALTLDLAVNQAEMSTGLKVEAYFKALSTGIVIGFFLSTWFLMITRGLV